MVQFVIDDATTAGAPSAKSYMERRYGDDAEHDLRSGEARPDEGIHGYGIQTVDTNEQERGGRDLRKLLSSARPSHRSIESPWLRSIEDDLRRKESYNGSTNYSMLIGHNIFRVPRQLREVKPLAYEPLVIAIGPYRKSRKMQPSVTEAFMTISAMNLLLALQNLGPDDFEGFVRRITNPKNIPSAACAEKLTKQYDRIPPYHEDELLTLFALDASFIACFLVYLGAGRRKITRNPNSDNPLHSEITRNHSSQNRLRSKITRNPTSKNLLRSEIAWNPNSDNPLRSEIVRNPNSDNRLQSEIARRNSNSENPMTASQSYGSGVNVSAPSELERRVISDLKIPKRLVGSIVRDLFLLENQIPLSLIKGVFDSVYASLNSAVVPEAVVDPDEEAEMALGQNVELLIRIINPFQHDAIHHQSTPALPRGGGGGGAIEAAMNCGGASADEEAPDSSSSSSSSSSSNVGSGVIQPSSSWWAAMTHVHGHLLDCLYTAVTDQNCSAEEAQKLRPQKSGSEMGIATEIEAQMELPTAVESAIHLRRAGIAFKPAEEDIVHTTDRSKNKKKKSRRNSSDGAMCKKKSTVQCVRFDRASGTLYLPKVKIGPETEAVLRNLAAYEMVALQRAEVSSYLALMDDLIDSAADVEALRTSGVLVHSLRDDAEVAEVWNSLCTNLQVLYESAELSEAYAGVKQHLRSRVRYKRLRELCADFSSRYLSAPWLTASVLGATLLLLLTITQTFYSAAIYYKS